MHNITSLSSTKIALLGNTTDISSAWWQNFNNVTLKFYLQSLSRKLVNHNRIDACMRVIAPTQKTVQVRVNKDLEIAHYRNLCRCGNIWGCPLCASTITEYRKNELVTMLANSDLHTYMATFTLSHKSYMSLEMSINAITKAWRYFTSGRWWVKFQSEFGYIGHVRSTEVTFGFNGWHPHYHVLLVFDKAIKKGVLKEYMVDRWLKGLKRNNYEGTRERALNVKQSDQYIAEYMAKWGYQPEGTTWSIEHEMTKQPVKRGKKQGLSPQRLLMCTVDPEYKKTAQNRAKRLYVEYFQTMSGRNQLNWSHGLKSRFDIENIDDKEIVQREAVDYEILTELEPYDWEKVVYHRKRGELLNIASQGNLEQLTAFISDLPSKPIKELIMLNEMSKYEDMTHDQKVSELKKLESKHEELKRKSRTEYESPKMKKDRRQVAKLILKLKEARDSHQQELI